jgi:hypothetical protein
VAPNWALTALHLFDQTTDPSAYSLRFGVVDDSTDATGSANLRTLDRIVLHPQIPDLALAHFADPVPDGTWIPQLASRVPAQHDRAFLFGWGQSSSTLREVRTLIIDPAATANAAYLRSVSSEFDRNFPPGVSPMVLNVRTESGDSGSGVFANGVLAGIHVMFGRYRATDAAGRLREPGFLSAFEQPVWPYRDWIRSVIDGEGTSGPKPTNDELRRRRLADAGDGDLPMSLPPQMEMCEPGQTSCTAPAPTWAPGSLLGSGNNRGTVQAVCAAAAGNDCSFKGTAYAGGAIARLQLGPSKAPGTGPRQVMVWCKTSSAFSQGGPLYPALRVSFTNADQDEVPIGMGWWDVMTDQVGTGAGQTLVDADLFATC